MDHRRHSSAGFTLTELLIATGFFIVLSASGAAIFGSVTPQIRANSQVNRILSLLQNGRDSAISKQRPHVLQFDLVNHRVSLLRREEDEDVLVDMVAFEYGMQLQLPSGAPDTPDGYGNDGPTDFGSALAVMFDSEGSLVDEDALPINGTIYFGIPGKEQTTRAVTVTGSTGRARFYIWNGNQEWEGGWLAK
jgi:type II secretory pathway pseudopilin PulG